MQAKGRNSIIHVLGCLIFLALPVLFSPDFGDINRMVQIGFFRRDFCLNLLLLFFFYLNYYYLTPRFYIAKKQLYFFGLIALSYIIIVCVSESMMWLTPMSDDFHFQHGPPHRHHWLPFSVTHGFLQFLIILIFSMLLRIREQLKRAESEKVNAELSYLKAQINPHFLFNTLNSIYSLAILKSDKTADAVVKLSDMMRYVLDDSNARLVLLDKELGYISSYIELQRMRLGPDVRLDYRYEGDMAGKQIAPLILIPFIENAFKHGINTEEDSKLDIHIRVSDNVLKLHVKNNCVHTNNQTLRKSGLGIENTKRRLKLLYPEHHSLTISKTERSFIVNLSLTIYD